MNQKDKIKKHKVVENKKAQFFYNMGICPNCRSALTVDYFENEKEKFCGGCSVAFKLK